ncbi:MAG: amidoligase family protein [Tenericutes bacterium]|nr:amidoligase family protein [Mycoplasmatota bacterium]
MFGSKEIELYNNIQNEKDYEQKIKYVSLIKSDELLEKLVNENSLSLSLVAINSMSNDALKMKYLYMFSTIDKIKIISSFTNKDNIKSFLFQKEFYNYIPVLLKCINDYNYTFDFFMNTKDIDIKKQIIEYEDNVYFKNVLLDNISPRVIGDIIKSNDNPKLENVLMNYDVDTRITFGLELECLTENYKEVLNCENILKNWKITQDASVKKGVEIISPVLNYDQESIKELKYVCEMLARNNFSVDNTCGGHVHLGFDYFEDVFEYATFLTLYSRIENLLYIIGNRSGTTTRDGFSEFAIFLNDDTLNIVNNINYAKFNSMDSYVDLIKGTQYHKFYGLNLTNIGNKEKNTIEFRFPNGELDFNEIIHNIKLFAKLFEVSKEITYTRDKKLLSLYRDIISSYDMYMQIENLLDLLFDNDLDKEFYMDRYEQNVELNYYI